VPKAADPLSRTPAYKSIAVTIEPDLSLVGRMAPAPAITASGTPRDTMNAC